MSPRDTCLQDDAALTRQRQRGGCIGSMYRFDTSKRYAFAAALRKVARVRGWSLIFGRLLAGWCQARVGGDPPRPPAGR
jgi:hypothetical protein